MKLGEVQKGISLDCMAMLKFSRETRIVIVNTNIAHTPYTSLGVFDLVWSVEFHKVSVSTNFIVIFSSMNYIETQGRIEDNGSSPFNANMQCDTHSTDKIEKKLWAEVVIPVSDKICVPFQPRNRLQH